MKEELNLCPFCGGKVKIGIYDDEGNLHNEEYENNPYSGLWFAIQHFKEDIPENCGDCFLAKEADLFHEDHIGSMYSARKYLIKDWNRGMKK